MLNAVTRPEAASTLSTFRNAFPSTFLLLRENILTVLNFSEFYNKFLGKSHFNSRVVNYFLAKQVTVTQAISKKHPPGQGGH